jgi:hypothetical protein
MEDQASQRLRSASRSVQPHLPEAPASPPRRSGRTRSGSFRSPQKHFPEFRNAGSAHGLNRHLARALRGRELAGADPAASMDEPSANFLGLFPDILIQSLGCTGPANPDPLVRTLLGCHAGSNVPKLATARAATPTSGAGIGADASMDSGKRVPCSFRKDGRPFWVGFAVDHDRHPSAANSAPTTSRR